MQKRPQRGQLSFAVSTFWPQGEGGEGTVINTYLHLEREAEC